MKLLLSVFLLFAFALSNAQTDSSSAKKDIPVYTFVEQFPEFPGGDNELSKFLQQNTKYPQMELDNNIQGSVIVKFIVMEDGSVDSVVAVRSVSPGLDKEAMRVVKMLNFKPGMQQGKPVRVYYHLPIVFKLMDNTPKEDAAIKDKINKDENFRNAYGQFKFQKWNDAIKYLKKSIKQFPNDYMSYEFKAESELNLGKKKDACVDYKIAEQKGSPTATNALKKNCE